jgi:peptidoglycan hydrolase-like protein with peptidoglycan-binding domain
MILENPAELFAPNSATGNAQNSFDFVETSSEAPTLENIRSGQIMDADQSGESVKQIQAMLTKAGFKVEPTGVFDANTEKQVIAFQKSWGISTTGKMGPTTLKALDTAQLGSSPLARAIANTARSMAEARGTVGQCYNAVANAIESHIKPFLSGGHAYMAANQFANHPRFREIPVPANMNQLPVGAVVVWGQGNSESGHISVHLGQGQEASDHVATQMQNHYGGAKPRIFLPV